jgi:hypothetical protein
MPKEELFDADVQERMLAMAKALRERKMPGVYVREGPRGPRRRSDDIVRRAVSSAGAAGPGYHDACRWSRTGAAACTSRPSGGCAAARSKDPTDY